MEIRNFFDPIRRLSDMQDNLRMLNQYSEMNRKSIELRVEKWATPFSILPLAIYASQLGLKITTGRNSQRVKRYLKQIIFPEGTTNLGWGRSTSYLPISILKIEDDDEILSKYEELILQSIKNESLRSSFHNSLKYLTSEMVTNIKEHAHVDKYWIFSQYWPASEICEITIADTGIGYLESYRGTEYEVDNHADAISNALQGNSSKDDIERGTGIPGMINIFCKGYGGCVAIISGDTLFFMEKEVQDFYSLEVDWAGVFIGLRFKLSEINALAYLSGN